MYNMNMNYNWKLSDGYPEKNGYRVFSCFSCGGGSTMGYKLAGFEVIGNNEIDPKMNECYVKNHNPKYSFLEPIQDFKNRGDLPKELFELDILDGSPPCSSFSMAGNREKDWGKEKKFREGQSEQILDTLFFDFIDLAKKLQPKVVIAENVKGLLMGDAVNYVRKINEEFEKAGYYIQHHLLDASKMGVPQKRERVFFIALRKDLAEPFLYQKTMFDMEPELKLEFNEPKILFGEFKDENGRIMSKFQTEIWENREEGDSDFSCTNTRFRNKPNTGFGQNYLYTNKVCGTITSHEDCYVLFDSPRYTSKNEVCKIGSYPLDYDFRDKKPHYMIGMSVPPLMTAKIAEQIKTQWLDKLVL